MPSDKQKLACGCVGECWLDAQLREVRATLPEGVQIVSLGDPAALHGAIREAVGE